MAKVKTYNLEGKEIGELELAEKIFGLPKNDELVHQVYVSLLSNKRQVIADTKTRGERAGSGIMPWRQKGTGRARVGSVRTPVWRKGGIVFGPTSDRNYKQKVNRKMNAKAIATVLSGKVRDKELVVIDKVEFPELKTKKMAKALADLKIKGSALLVLAEKEKNIGRASRNLSKVTNASVLQLNVLSMLNSRYLILSKESVQYLEKKYK